MSGDLAIVTLVGRSSEKDVSLPSYLDAEGRESAARESNAWIKALRQARVDGRTLRDRFTYRGDSLWWFTELYLHKMGAVTTWFETLRALQACVSQEAPRAIRWAGVDPARSRTLLTLGPQVAAARGVAWLGPAAPEVGPRQRLAFSTRCAYYTWSAHASRLRPGQGALPAAKGGIVGFVHSAFWRSERTAGSVSGEEGYIGPVLRALADPAGAQALTLVGVGPRMNFRARRVWHAWSPSAVAASSDLPYTPVERFSAPRDIRPSLEVWRARHDNLKALLRSDDLRALAQVDACDVWPLLVPELAGVTDLQFPWSARAMDEAGAVLDRLEPRAVVTYAEAGGWGRAVVLEARRRRIPSAGLQHGFIYRHWLNYLHERDEMAASSVQPEDAGFPHPTLTLLYDRYAEEHLRRAGNFPGASLAVTGSPRLDALVAGVAALGKDDLARTREAVGARQGQQLVLVASKHSQIARAFPVLVHATGSMPDVRLVVKTHPAETAEPYVRDAAGANHVTVAPASADLASLVAVSRLVVTVNSTVAIDAMVLGVPGLVVDLPNNLSPFVEAGVMSGAGPRDDLAPLLRRALADESSRREWNLRRAAFLERYAISSDGGSARRAADEVRRLAAEAQRAVPYRL